jgi:hypothetical protein
MTTRTWISTVLLAALVPAPAFAQAMIEAGAITSKSATVARPDWAKDENSAPATRFVQGAGIADGSWFRAMGVEPGAFSSIGQGSAAQPQRAITVVPKPARPKSKDPGRVAGLVYEQGTKAPLAGVTVRMVSTEPQWAVERLEARTDSAGYYELPRVEPGAWLLGIVGDRLSTRYAPPRTPLPLAVAKRDSVAAPSFALHRTACVKGHAGWSDGYVLYDAPLTVAPFDSTQFSRTTTMNGVGDFDLCGAPEDSVMVWMHLRDGRSIGRAMRLTAASEKAVQFTPDPIERMEGVTLKVLPVLNGGVPVPRAQVTVVGRRFEQGDRPALVYVRQETADQDGAVEFRVPFGVYEVLVMNPREGQTGRVSRLVINENQQGVHPLEVVLRGASTQAEQRTLRSELLNRAETYLYVWGQ